MLYKEVHDSREYKIESTRQTKREDGCRTHVVVTGEADVLVDSVVVRVQEAVTDVEAPVGPLRGAAGVCCT